MTSPGPSLPRAGRLLGPLLFLLFAPGCFFFGFRPSADPQHPTVTALDLEGVHAVSEKELRERLATQPSGRKYLVWPVEQPFDADAFANDQRRIVRYYQAQGYYSARVESAEALPDGKGRVKVVVRIVEGPPVRVTRLEVDGLEGAPEAREKLGKLPLREGDVFTEAAYDQARAAILAALTSTGWAKAEVTQHAQVDPVLAQAHVRFAVTPGPRYRFGNVFVAGAAAIPRARIREEAEVAVRPGEVFDATDLPKAQARVFDLGVFGGVRVAQGPADEKRGTIPVTLSVREAPFRTIRLGPSFGIQLNRWDLSAVAGWQHRNWLGGLRKLNLDLRAGYAWLPNPFTSTKQGVVGLATADFTQPEVFRHVLDFNLRGELERGLEPAYDFFAERFRIGLPLRLGRTFGFAPSYNLELYQLSNRPSVAEGATAQNITLQTCPGGDPNLCVLSYLEQRVTLDLRDDPIKTTKGLYLSVSFQEGFRAFGAGSNYFRFLPEARGFVSLWGVVVAARARLGLVEPLGGSTDVPIVAKFTSGGPNLMRGYYNRQLSPVFYGCQTPASPRTGTPARGCDFLPVGGNGLIDGSIELRFPIAGNLGGAVFLDFGDVRLSSTEALRLDNLQYGAGLGIRYNTIFGPLRVDVATRLPTAPGGNWPGVQVVTLGSDGRILPTGDVHHDPIVSLHISIGEAF